MRYRPLIRYAIIMLITFTVITITGSTWLHFAFTIRGPSQSDIIVTVPRGAGLRTAAVQLREAGVISDARAFEASIRFLGLDGSLRAGEFRFPARSSMADVLRIIMSGEMVQRRVTVPEGLTSRQIVRLLETTEGLEGKIDNAPEEGSLLPDTYFFTLWDGRAELLRRMKDRRTKLLYNLWIARDVDSPLKNPDEALILASIVEKETSLASERPRVAAVFLNRLERGIRLQSDPTIIYGLTGGEPLGRSLFRSEVESDTPYNTYRIYGLPPGPIANPGPASIEAVLHPADTDDLYFVADGSGGHAFASSLEEHNANVANWRRIERERKRQGADQ